MDKQQKNDSLVSRDYEKELEKMSPFEIKNKLIEMAQEDARKSTATFLNAGRGNPNWIATVPREAFFLLGKWAISECRRVKDVGDGIAGIPSQSGSAHRLKQFLLEHKGDEAATLLEGAFEYLTKKKGADADDIAHEWAEAVIGDQHTVSPADLPFIISGIKKTPTEKKMQIVAVESFSCLNGFPKAKVTLRFGDTVSENSAKGTGGYDAFVKALKKCLKTFGFSMPKLLDYEVRIPPGGRTDALVETTITWSFGGKSFVTTGVDSDQLLAAIGATEKILNIMVK